MGDDSHAHGIIAAMWTTNIPHCRPERRGLSAGLHIDAVAGTTRSESHEFGWRQPIVVDSNNAKNATNASCNVSGSWTASNNVGGFYQTGYFWRSTGSSSDLAEFKANLPSAKKMLVEAYWPAASDRSPNAPFVIHNAAGDHLGTVTVNQQKNGSSWVTLGTFNFTAGWNVVALSRWTTSGYVVVADAVRFTEVP